MNYEFHVGDYIENSKGDVGWVTSVTDDNIVWETNDGKTYVMKVSILNRVQYPEALFVRIGAHDFTKKEKKKIENITKPQWSMPVEDLIDKINDLVDAVNKLMDKEDEE